MILTEEELAKHIDKLYQVLFFPKIRKKIKQLILQIKEEMDGV